ncbi:MAG TPA: EscU/YscU/HrcU family type III secretion system export apparatus switch protein [Methylophilaceae bacterium]|jgi:flagellar biosynthesis protein
MNNPLTYTPRSQVSVAETTPEAPNPLKQQAIALAYETGDFAPKVVAKGRGLIAEQIIARAKEHNVFVHESKDLVALLMQVDLDDHIPPVLYQAIAEILAWLYNLEHGVTQAPLA